MSQDHHLIRSGIKLAIITRMISKLVIFTRRFILLITNRSTGVHIGVCAVWCNFSVEYSGTVPGYKYSEYSEYLHYLSQYTSYAKVKMLFFDVGCNSHYIYPRVVLRILFALLDLYTDNR